MANQTKNATIIGMDENGNLVEVYPITKAENVDGLYKVVSDLVNEVTLLKATLDAYGIVRISDSEAVTDSTGLALAATEKNAAIPGTLANQILRINNDLYCYDVEGTGYNGAYKTVRQINSETGINSAQLKADQEGGGVYLSKGGGLAYLELDTWGQNGSDGFARMYLGNHNQDITAEFKFREDGTFVDGNGNASNYFTRKYFGVTDESLTAKEHLRNVVNLDLVKGFGYFASFTLANWHTNNHYLYAGYVINSNDDWCAGIILNTIPHAKGDYAKSYRFYGRLNQPDENLYFVEI